MLGEHPEIYRNICCPVVIQRSIIPVTKGPWPLILGGPGRKVAVRVSISVNCQGFALVCGISSLQNSHKLTRLVAEK